MTNLFTPTRKHSSRNPRDAQARLDFLTVLLDQNLGEMAAPYLAECSETLPMTPEFLGWRRARPTRPADATTP